jgi:hypothetical protein
MLLVPVPVPPRAALPVMVPVLPLVMALVPPLVPARVQL